MFCIMGWEFNVRQCTVITITPCTTILVIQMDMQLSVEFVGSLLSF